MLKIEKHIPPGLRTLVDSFWYIHVNGPVGAVFEEVIIPDGYHEIIFHDKPGNAQRSANGTHWIQEPAALMLGQTTKPYRLRLANGSKLIGIRFLPHTPGLFLDIPAKEFTDAPQAAALICGISGLSKHIDFEAPAKTFSRLEHALVCLLNEKRISSAKFACVDFAVRKIAAGNGLCRIEDIVQKTGVSPKYLNTLFDRWIGLTPKTFSNIVRLARFLEMIKSDTPFSLTTAAHASGFFDQAHLIKSFRQFAGLSPKEYLRQQTLINDYFVHGGV